MVDNTNDVTLLIRRQRLSLRDMVPFLQTAATAGGGGVLSDKHRMPAHGSLLTVIFGLRGRQPPGDKICRVAIDNLRAFINTILPLFYAKAKATAECGSLQPRKQTVEGIHQ